MSLLDFISMVVLSGVLAFFLTAGETDESDSN